MVNFVVIKDADHISPFSWYSYSDYVDLLTRELTTEDREGDLEIEYITLAYLSATTMTALGAVGVASIALLLQ